MKKEARYSRKKNEQINVIFLLLFAKSFDILYIENEGRERLTTVPTEEMAIRRCNMADTQKAVNYTAEMTAAIVEQYQNGVEIDEIAASIEKSVRSVRSKLVREGVYVAQPKVAARKQDGPTKKEILRDLEATGFDVVGFEGATKDALVRLMGVVAQ